MPKHLYVGRKRKKLVGEGVRLILMVCWSLLDGFEVPRWWPGGVWRWRVGEATAPGFDDLGLQPGLPTYVLISSGLLPFSLLNKR